MPVCVVTDSVSSLPAEDRDALSIEMVPLFVHEGGTSVPESEIDPHEFYRRLASMPAIPTSSQPSVESLITAFTKAVERGCDVVGVFISEQMSGTVQTARMAAEMVRESLPDARIAIVDSRSNSMQEGFAVEAAARAAKAGETLERCVEEAVATIPRSRWLFTPETLEYLRRGGRIGAASALLGTLLNIRPVLTVANGVTAPFAKVRTQSKAMAEIGRKFAEDVAAFGLADVIVHYIGEPDVAQKFSRDHIEPVAGRAVRIVPVSTVVGVHVGPAVGIVYQTVEELVR